MQTTSFNLHLSLGFCYFLTELVVSEELDAHPAPEVEEDVDGDGDGQQQAVETQAAAAGAALREVLIHGRREEQTKQRHDGDQPDHHGQGQHVGVPME